MTTRILETPSDSEAVIRRIAFGLLITQSEPIDVDQLSAATGIKSDRLSVLLDELDSAGRIRRDESGHVVGSAGLSVVPDRHEIEIGGQKFWTWCAYDILGIFGALGASGRAVSPSPGGPVIELQFDRGRPVDNHAVLFRPDEELMTCCENVYEEWCPNSNLFADAEQANRWAEEHGMRGRVMVLDEASDLGTKDWADVI
jgi:Alkylmercury lyase/DprA winged helix domain